jgi:hypothetical protein
LGDEPAWRVCLDPRKVGAVQVQLATTAAAVELPQPALTCYATHGIDDCCVAGVVAENEEESLSGAWIKRAGQGYELAGRVQLEAPMDAGDGEPEKRGDEQVSGPSSLREESVV